MRAMESNRTNLKRLLEVASPLIDLALAEDLMVGGEGHCPAIADPSTQSTIDSGACMVARIVAKDRGVIAGLAVAEELLRRVDPRIEWIAEVEDGQAVVPGERIAVISGPAVSLLAAERAALNFLQRLSGIATATRDMVDAVVPTDATILDTRKTVPGFRVLDKYAVWIGGGENHRLSLGDMLLIKDNHIDAIGSLSGAVSRARTAHPELLLEVEVANMAQLDEALAIQPPVDRILLDNLSLEQMAEAVQLASGRVPLEASGNVTLETVRAISATGVEYISVGGLTHSASALDLSMRVEKIQRTRRPIERSSRFARSSVDWENDSSFSGITTFVTTCSNTPIFEVTPWSWRDVRRRPTRSSSSSVAFGSWRRRGRRLPRTVSECSAQVLMQDACWRIPHASMPYAKRGTRSRMS